MENNTKENRVIQALMWLGFEDVEVGNKFSAEKFENNQEDVLEKEITYSSKDNLVPKAVSGQLIKFMENLINYHDRMNKAHNALNQKGEDNV